MTALNPPFLPLVVCADDYGLTPGIGRGIRALIEAGRVSATSCMTCAESWRTEAELILPFLDRADIGLHFTLTDHRPLGAMPRLAPNGRFPPLSALVKASLRGELDRGEIAAELERQLLAFEAATGRLPSHIDGHHHVHGLPGVREVVLDVFSRRLQGRNVYLRCCDEPLSAVVTRRAASFRAGAISLFGRGFARRVRAAGYPANRRFVGVRNFTVGEDYGDLMRRFLSKVQPKTLLMCHPGFSDPLLSDIDGVTWQREDEYRYLAGQEFPMVLRSNSLRISRFDPSCPPKP